MIAFKKIWDDICEITSKNSIENLKIIENFDSGFVVEDDADIHFITKDDFIDFWCNMLYPDKVSKEEVLNNSKSKYIYEIMRNLPYVCENNGIIKIAE